MPRPELLYISPVMPALTGNGLAMRAGMVLEALAGSYSVSLRVVRLYAGPEVLPEGLRGLCRKVEAVEPSRREWRSRIARLLAFRQPEFHTVHVFRLAALPFAGPMMEGRGARPKLHLDLDDLESETHRRLASLHFSNDDPAGAAVEEALARMAEAQSREAMARVDRVYVCSEADQVRLKQRASVEVRVLPNAVRIPVSDTTQEPESPFRFLMIGTLGYYPNDDAARYLCREIIPRLRECTARPFEFDIAGGGATAALCEAARSAGANLRGRVADVEESYRRAGAVVAPLRAGGGTRIKILEAFGYRRPVVSTSVGAEGIAARHEQEILLGDTPESVVEGCLRLMSDGELRSRLAENAFKLVERSYSSMALRQVVASFPV